MAFNGGERAGNRKMDIIFMFVNVIWPEEVCSCLGAKPMYMIMNFIHLRNCLASQNQILCVAYLQIENECS